MAYLTTCDGGCGAISPDPKTRLHVANRWFVVRAGYRHEGFARQDERDDKLFCKACAQRVIAALQPEGGR